MKNTFYLKLVQKYGKNNAGILYKLLEEKNIDAYQEKIMSISF